MELDLEKLAKKRLYKLTGVVESFNWVNNFIGNLIVSKGAGKNKQLFKFTVMQSDDNGISKLVKNYRIRVWFKIKTTQYGDKLYTELFVKYHEYWQVNELKKKKEAYLKQKQDETEYQKSLNVSFDNTDFLTNRDNFGFDPDMVSDH